MKGALIIVAISLLIFYTTLLYFNILALFLSPIVFILFIIYPLTKRFTYLCHYFLGLIYLVAPPAVEIALTGKFSFESFLLGLAGLFWVSGFDLIYAILDIDFDLKNKIYSVPSKFGIRVTKILSSISHTITLILIFLIGINNKFKSNLLDWLYNNIVIIFKRTYDFEKYYQKNINKAFLI